MLIGKYNVELLNSGKFSIRWIDKKTNKYTNFICSNLEGVLDLVTEGNFITEQVRQLYDLFYLYCTSMVDFLASEETQFIDRKDRWCFEEQDFYKVADMFVKSYNKKNDTSISLYEIYQLVLPLEEAWRNTWHHPITDWIRFDGDGRYDGYIFLCIILQIDRCF